MKKITLLLALIAFTMTAASYAEGCPACPNKDKSKKEEKDKKA